MKDGGYVALWRKIQGSDLWVLSPIQIIVGLVCVMNAEWRPRTVYGYEVKRGEWLTHYHEIRDCCPKGTTTKQVRCAMKKLGSRFCGFLGTRSIVIQGRRFVLVSICKYDDYQIPGHTVCEQEGTRFEESRALGGHEKGTALPEEVKEVREIKEGKTISVNHLEFLELWNQVASHRSELRPIRKMSKSRLTRLRSLSTDPDFRENWRAAVKAVRFGHVDWFLRADNWQVPLERKESEISGRKALNDPELERTQKLLEEIRSGREGKP